MVLVIDNYDSFTYNLVQYLGELGANLQVRRNDAVNLGDVGQMAPDRIVISPGPGRPEDAGISVALVQDQHTKVPILGVCLGHQAIGVAFGGAVIPAPNLVHGKTSTVDHKGDAVLEGIPIPFSAGRYHSLSLDRTYLPVDLEVIATAREDQSIMAVRHRRYPVFGLQFHPESVLTSDGRNILNNFLRTDKLHI